MPSTPLGTWRAPNPPAPTTPRAAATQARTLRSCERLKSSCHAILLGYHGRALGGATSSPSSCREGGGRGGRQGRARWLPGRVATWPPAGSRAWLLPGWRCRGGWLLAPAPARRPAGLGAAAPPARALQQPAHAQRGGPTMTGPSENRAKKLVSSWSRSSVENLPLPLMRKVMGRGRRRQPMNASHSPAAGRAGGWRRRARVGVPAVVRAVLRRGGRRDRGQALAGRRAAGLGRGSLAPSGTMPWPW
jgi:hypothetical protein